ncbi:MAG: hypothetical protein MJ025_03685 [Victivallaceae bacterium]|nr:hypothetical protein [Victivallaceae bacterium]
MTDAPLVPFKLVPEYRRHRWAGGMFRTILKRDTDSLPGGESLEVFDLPECSGVIGDGPFSGCSLHELVESRGEELLGRRLAGSKRFPVTLRLIDAGSRLGLRVHPACESGSRNDLLYVMACSPGAKMQAGLARHAAKSAIGMSPSDNDLDRMMLSYLSYPGDSYFIPCGTPYSIGAGNLVLSIGDNLGETFVLNDWGAGGEESTDLFSGIDAVNFTMKVPLRSAGSVDRSPFNRKFEIVRDCPRFGVWDMRLVSRWLDCTGGRCHLVTATNGAASIGGPDGEEIVRLATGDTAVVPAGFGNYTVTPEREGITCVLECIIT